MPRRLRTPRGGTRPARWRRGWGLGLALGLLGSLPAGGESPPAGGAAAGADRTDAPDASAAPGPSATPATEIDAMRAELERGLARARLPGAPDPYFAELRLVRAELLTIDGSYGGIITDLHERQAGAKLELRVGTPERDNGGFFGLMNSASFQLPLEPEPRASRRVTWLGFDAALRAAVSTYEARQSAVARLAGAPPPAGLGVGPGARLRLDWSGEDTSTASPRDPVIEPMAADRPGLRAMVRALSDRFNDHPRIDNGDVTLSVIRSYEVTITSEGVTLGRQRDQAVLAVVAQTQAADGMTLDAGAALHLQSIPAPDEQLRREGEAMVDRVLAELEALVDAPMIEEDYDGPLLFEPAAAAGLLASTLGVHALATPAPLSDYGRLVELEPFLQDRLGKPVMPPWIDVIDDPGAEGFGHYEVDAEGFDASEVRLVHRGVLSDLLSTRTPGEHVDRSNGHARGVVGLGVAAAISNLSLIADRPGLGAAALERELLARARDDGYDHAYVVEALRDGTVLGPAPRDSAAAYGTGRKVTLALPSRLLRVEADGRRTLVRGAIFSPVSLRVLRRIREVGDRSLSLPMRIEPGVIGGFSADGGLGSMLVQTVDAQVTCPALLVDGFELTVERGEHQRLPVLTHPLRRGPEGASARSAPSGASHAAAAERLPAR